jgi:hypothetical protein
MGAMRRVVGSRPRCRARTRACCLISREVADYISSSPFRVPIERLAAAQAALGRTAASSTA